ncbi:MAG TPA: hypothetical protein DEA91_02935 [Paenibacillus sp.]|nr:hypothetical protein [Paenibacillus sp.]
MGEIVTVLFQNRNNINLGLFCKTLEEVNFFPAASSLNKLDDEQVVQVKPVMFLGCIEIKFGSIYYKFNKQNQQNLGFLIVNRSWSDFLSYPPTTTITRKICLEVMEYFDSTEAIYLSDMYSYDYFYDNTSWSDIKKSLSRRFGSPANKVEDIYKEFEEHIETDGYFIEKR